MSWREEKMNKTSSGSVAKAELAMRAPHLGVGGGLEAAQREGRV